MAPTADPYVHLHVASGYSLQYGASPPQVLVERAVEREMDTLALTDRDGAYGAVRFVKACSQAGVRPVLGVDLAVLPTVLPGPSSEAVAPGATSDDVPGRGPRQQERRQPARGGAFRALHDPRLPRAVFLAHGRRGWAAVCRLVSATHLAGERGTPVATLDLVAEHLGGEAGRDVLVLLGPGSEPGQATTLRREDLARASLAPWREVLAPENLLVEVVSHRVAGSGPGSSPHAARMLGLAHDQHLGVVLSNAVRYADRSDAPTVDVLDAARRLVPLDVRHLDRRNAEGFLKSGKEMAEVAEEVCRFAGVGHDAGREARRLLARTRAVADRCALDPRADLGMGEVHFPELELAGGGFDGLNHRGGGLNHRGGGGFDGLNHRGADAVLRARCEAGIGRRYGTVSAMSAMSAMSAKTGKTGKTGKTRERVRRRLDDELAVIASLGYASYFLTVADITDLVREMGVRCAARGSGAGSLVTYLLGISDVDPLRHRLLMERFLSPLRSALPDVDLDVESARRLEVYEAILDRYGGERCVCVSMMDTYRVRHAVRDVGAALGMPPGEVDAIAKAFPHIRARDARVALRELPELRGSGLAGGAAGASFETFFRLVERLDGLPRHVAMHPCGVLLSDATLLDRTPVEASFAGYPMSQFDKEDVEDLGLLKLDVLGIRMQSAMAHAVAEIGRTEQVEVDLDDEAQVPFDDPATYQMISRAQTLGCFQIESPGQRELVGKSGIETFEDLITDISLFRPGPVKSDMVTPYLEAKQGWTMPRFLHEDLREVLGQTRGVVVFHEQVIEMVALFTGCSLAEADEARRALGYPEGMERTRLWFHPRALGRGYPLRVVEEVWRVLEAFASFGFCKAHAAAFALPTYQSAWLKAHYPAHFLAGVLTHDPGMYPKRLILDDARRLGIAVLGLDVNHSQPQYAVERLDPSGGAGPADYGIRVALGEVKGISQAEVERLVAARPFHGITDVWHRAAVSRPVLERLVLAGGFDRLYALGSGPAVHRRATVTRRDLLLQVADLERHTRAARHAGRGRGRAAGTGTAGTGAMARPREAAVDGVRARAAAQSRTATTAPLTSVQTALDLGDSPQERPSGLPEMDAAERVRAELEVLGLDTSSHVMDLYHRFLTELGVTWSRDLLHRRSRSELLVAGVKVATQTPPVRTGRRVVFLTLDDATGPVDATFFEDVQGSCAATVFGSWLLVVRGELRRTGRYGVSLRATGCWELTELHRLWEHEGLEAVYAAMAAYKQRGRQPEDTREGHRRVLVHSSGFAMSPYSDIRPAGEDPRSGQPPRKLWHSSPGSAGG